MTDLTEHERSMGANVNWALLKLVGENAQGDRFRTPYASPRALPGAIGDVSLPSGMQRD